VPTVHKGFDWNLDQPGSRFVRRPAIAIPRGGEEWQTQEEAERGVEDALRDSFGDWLFEEQETLGRGKAVVGSVGRGAGTFAAVVEFVAIHAAGGVVSVAAGMAFKRVWQRASEALRGRDVARLDVSRGGAAALAVAEVAESFGEDEGLEIEAVEEPSSITGREVSELSYVGVEPWIVLLMNRERRVRYVVVVASDGEILSTSRTPMGESEEIFLLPPEDSEWAQGGEVADN
jgi:hypothetical protein